MSSRLPAIAFLASASDTHTHTCSYTTPAFLLSRPEARERRKFPPSRILSLKAWSDRFHCKLSVNVSRSAVRPELDERQSLEDHDLATWSMIPCQVMIFEWLPLIEFWSQSTTRDINGKRAMKSIGPCLERQTTIRFVKNFLMT